MLILAIETTGPVSSVALNRDGIITEIKNEDSYSHLQQLMPMVKRLMDEEGVKGAYSFSDPWIAAPLNTHYIVTFRRA